MRLLNGIMTVKLNWGYLKRETLYMYMILYINGVKLRNFRTSTKDRMRL